MLSQTRSEEPAAEARKADGASCTAVQMPSPPNLTGSDARIQARSFALKRMLVMPLAVDLSKSS